MIQAIKNRLLGKPQRVQFVTLPDEGRTHVFALMGTDTARHQTPPGANGIDVETFVDGAPTSAVASEIDEIRLGVIGHRANQARHRPRFDQRRIATKIDDHIGLLGPHDLIDPSHQVVDISLEGEDWFSRFARPGQQRPVIVIGRGGQYQAVDFGDLLQTLKNPRDQRLARQIQQMLARQAAGIQTRADHPQHFHPRYLSNRQGKRYSPR